MFESFGVANILVYSVQMLFVPKRMSCMVTVVKSNDWHRVCLCCTYCGQ